MSELILIEDFAPLRRIMTSALREAGFNVTSFENGVVSSDADVMKQADLLITDIEMPLVDGHEVLENIRGMIPEIKTVVISGMVEEKLNRVKATAILRKPFEPSELIEMVKKTLAETTAA